MLHFCLSQNFNFFRFKSISYIIKFKKIKGFPQKAKSFRNTATYQKTQGGRVGVHQWGAPPPPYHVGDTSLRVRPNQICVVSFLYSYKDDLLENLGKIKPMSKNAKIRRPVDVRRSKTSLLKFRNVDRRPPLQRGSRCFDTVFWRPSQYFSIALKVICCMLEFK